MNRYALYAAMLLISFACGFLMERSVAMPIVVLMAFLWAWVDRPLPTEAVASTRAPWRDTAYLVAILNTRAEPPHVFYVGVFSAKASDLTNTGDTHLDIMHATGETYAEASERLIEAAKLYHPWVKPFLEKHE